MSKPRTRSFDNPTKTPLVNKNDKFGYSPEKSEGRGERSQQDLYRVRFKRKDLEHF